MPSSAYVTAEDIDLIRDAVGSPSTEDEYVKRLKDSARRWTSIEARVDINRFLSGQDTVSIMRRLAREDLGESATAEEIEACPRASLSILPLEVPDPPSIPTAESVQHDQATRDAPFVYDTLATRHIRLLRHVPSISHGVPHLTIESYPLDQAPKFSALSYTWGSPPLWHAMIFCNGRHKHITRNLYHALGRIFGWRDDIYLWADGLCINQEDILERNQQVRLMGEIYTRAERTVAYLGEPLHEDTAEDAVADPDEVPLALMQCLTRIWEKAGPDRPDQRSDEDWEMLYIPGMESNGMDSDSTRKWFSVLALCWQAWFTRAWVLQEVALARDVMVFYGSAIKHTGCSTALVYRHVAEAYIRNGYGVDILYQAGLPRSAHVDGLPSWIPDWSAQARRPLDESQYQCMKDTVSDMCLSRPTQSLIVHGAVIDSLFFPTYRVNFEQRPEISNLLTSPRRTWFSEFSELGVPADSIPYCHHGWNAAFQIIHGAERAAIGLLGERYHTGEQVRHVVWRTLVADTHWWSGGDGRRDKAAHDAYTRFVKPPTIFSSLPAFNMEFFQETWPLVAAVMNTVQGHCFSLTACGRMGLFPNEVRMGDLIAVVAGSRVPFVIRPRPDGKSYRLVGPCYVHGMMNGELLRRRRENGRPAPRDGEGRPYKVKLWPWLRSLMEKAKPRRHFDPDVCLEAEWKALCLA
ncbi:Ubiquitin-like protein [Madurella fahalii]|uniref:Ubiquitin-like protein n=1 Tax=Madurella fahalii TaxID=1157608 RepID=A0ABQ0FXY8_9PEZI